MPYVLSSHLDNAIAMDDVPKLVPTNVYYLRFRWYCIQSDKKVAVCSVQPSELATLQCLECVKAKIPISKSYHCSAKCFSESWHHHNALHAAASAVHENGTKHDELFGRFGSIGGLVGSTSSSGIQNERGGSDVGYAMKLS